MEIAAAFVANHAEIEGDKLYVAGGAWAWLKVAALPQSMVVQLAMVLVAEQDEQYDRVLVRVFISESTPMPTYGTELVVPWPTPSDLKPAQPIVVPVVLQVPFTAKRAGRHSLEIFVDHGTQSRRSVPFAILL
jgi:hypothetical protein